MTNNQQLTCGQLERALSQRIQKLYREKLGHQPGKIMCQIFDQKVAIVIENSMTATEALLAENNKFHLAQQVRLDVNQLIQQDLKELIEEVLQVSVLDLLSDAKLKTKRSGIIAILEKTPIVRNPEAIPKANQK
ncbi:MAG: DUF2294 domain-containing protein [Chroococcales cyanobacterium]